jgi:tetratricopeptide (TPR) repeat protein/DNA-binding XRE family transcriptional regulator
MTRPEVRATAALPGGSRLGERLRQLRVSAGMTQTDLAGDRFSKEYISQIERGKTRPTRETIDWLALRLCVDPTFLASGVSTDDRARAEATLARAETLVEKRDFDNAIDEYTKALPAVVATGAVELQVRVLSGEAWARAHRGEVRQGIELLAQARALVEAEQFSDLDRAEILFRLGVCRYLISSISTALALFADALALVERSPLTSDQLRSNILTWRSRCYRRQRDYEAAREDVTRALELAEGLQDPRSVAEAYFQASLIAERDGHWVLARTYAERAKAEYEQISDRIYIGRLTNNLGGLDFLLGNSDVAIRRFKEAFAIALEVGDDNEAATAVSSLAQAHLRTGDPRLAEEHARHALRLIGNREDRLDEIGNARLVLGRALLDQGRLSDAENALVEADHTFARFGSAAHQAATWVAQGDLAQRRGDDSGAARLYRRAAETLQDFRF